MPGTAGSKYGILTDGLPTVNRRNVIQKLEQLQKEPNMVIISNQLATKCIAMWRQLGKTELAVAEQANANGEHDAALSACKMATEYFNIMDELIVATHGSAPDNGAKLPRHFGVVNEAQFAEAVQAANAAMQRFNNHVEALRYALPNYHPGSGNETQSTEPDRAEKNNGPSSGLHSKAPGEKAQNQ